MADHKLLRQSTPGAEATPQAAAATAPSAPVPLPVVRRSADDGDFDFDQPTRQRRKKEDPVAGVFDFHQPTRQRRSKEDGPPLPPRQTEMRQLDHLENYRLAPDQVKPKADGSAPDLYAGTPSGKFSAESTKAKRDEVAKVKAGEREPTLHQPVADLGEIYAHCSMLNAEFEHQVRGISSVTKGAVEFRPKGAMKAIDRSLEKITADYGGDVSRIVDLSGGTIGFDSADDLVAGYGAVVANPMFKVVRVKNSLVKGQGYGDINLSLEMGSADFEVKLDNGETKMEHHAGYIVELQLHLDPIKAVKKDAHKPYEHQRTIDARYPGNKNRATWNPEDKTMWEDLDAQMKAMYGAAWDKIGRDAAVAALAKVKAQNPT